MSVVAKVGSGGLGDGLLGLHAVGSKLKNNVVSTTLVVGRALVVVGGWVRLVAGLELHGRLGCLGDGLNRVWL